MALRKGSNCVLPEETITGRQHYGIEFDGRTYDTWMPLNRGVPSSEYRHKYMDGQEASPTKYKERHLGEEENLLWEE